MLDVVRRTGGAVADVDDEIVVTAMRLLAATEGIFGETAGGVTLGVLRSLLASGQLDPDAETVIINSGDGLKTLDAVADVATPQRDPPTLDAFLAFEAALGGPSGGQPLSAEPAMSSGQLACIMKGRTGMTVSVRIPTILRTFTGGAAEVTADAGTLREVIAGLDASYPGIARPDLDDAGKLRRFVNVYVGRGGREAGPGARHAGAAGRRRCR